LETRVLPPALAQRLVGQIIRVLQDDGPSHSAHWQRRMPGCVAVDLAKLRLQKAPVDRLGELHQRVFQVDDLVEPRAKQMSGLSTYETGGSPGS